MRVFHRTWAAAAIGILTEGFKDGNEGFVWLSDVPLEGDDIKSGEGGDVCLTLDVPDEVITKYLEKQRKTHNAYQIPAKDIAGCQIGLAGTDYSGMTRDGLIALIETRTAEEAADRKPPKEGSIWSTSQSYRDALAFFDKFAPLP